MMPLAYMLAVVMLAMAALHVAWGLGVVWPATDEAALTRAVVGTPHRVRMPSPVACFIVAACLAAIGAWPLMQLGYIRLPIPQVLVHVAGGGIPVLFGMRGLMPYFAIRKSVEPFTTYDRRYYGPFCLALSVAFLLVLVRGAA